MANSKKSSGLPLILLGLAALIGVAGWFAYTNFGGAELVSSMTSKGSSNNSKGDVDQKGVVRFDTGPTYEDPVPKELKIPGELLEMITTKTARVEPVNVGELGFAIEGNNIVGARGDGSFELAGGRVLYPVGEFDTWNIADALETAGHGSRIDDFRELESLSVFDQHDIILTTTEENGLQYDYDFSEAAVLALKEDIVGSGRPVFQYTLGHRQVVQVGHATDRDGTRVIVYFPSDNVRAIDVTGHAQESIYWLVARMIEPDYEAATAKLAEKHARSLEAEDEEAEAEDLQGKGDGAIDVPVPTEKETD